MSSESFVDGFGCERCRPTSADAAHRARGTLRGVARIIDESHFRVAILACPACSQRFVSVFTETVDWVGGEDPQSWTLLPVTTAEAAGLGRRGGSLSEPELNALGRGRRCLRHDHPRAEQPRSFWGTGLSVGPHD